MRQIAVLAAVILCGLTIACNEAKPNPRFYKRADGTTMLHGEDGCDYILKDNGTFVKEDPNCKSKDVL